MKRAKCLGILAVSLLLAAAVSGCVGRSSEALYALPKQPDEYYELQHAIDLVLPSDASYSGPLSGSNQQAVQLADLDGDSQEEAIVFTKTSGERPMKVYIFDIAEDGTYKNTTVIEGDGSAFDSVEYLQLDGEPGLEILVGRQLSEQITQSLTVYAYRQESAVELMSSNYTEYTVADLDGNDCRDIFVLRMETEERSGIVDLYRCVNGKIEREPEVYLSAGAQQVKRIVSGYVATGVPAVFVASTYGEDTIVTDIFAFSGKRFQNISSNADTGLSTQTVRNYNVYASDIDSDGLIELPMPVVLPSMGESEETHWVIDWYNLMPDGQRQIKTTTYHNYPAGWYVELPEHWHGRLTVAKRDQPGGNKSYVFCKWNGYDKQSEEIFIICAFTGEDRMKKVSENGYFFLAEKGKTAYAARLGDSPWAEMLTISDVCTMFRFIQVDWNTGEI